MEQMMDNIQRHRQAVRDNIMKSFGFDDSLVELEVFKGEENDIEKAHKVGDVHPNGKWVWKEYAPGKFDWRGIKGGSSSGGASAAPAPNKPVSKPQSQPQASASQTKKTVADDDAYNVEEYKRQLDMAKLVSDESLAFGYKISSGNLKRSIHDYNELTKNRPNAKATIAQKYKDILYFRGQVKACEEELTKRGIDFNGSKPQAQPKQPQATPAQQSVQKPQAPAAKTAQPKASALVNKVTELLKEQVWQFNNYSADDVKEISNKIQANEKEVKAIMGIKFSEGKIELPNNIKINIGHYQRYDTSSRNPIDHENVHNYELSATVNGKNIREYFTSSRYTKPSQAKKKVIGRFLLDYINTI